MRRSWRSSASVTAWSPRARPSWSSRWATAIRSRSPRLRASPSTSRRRPGSPCWALTSSGLARLRRTSASCANPSRTRARVFGTRARRSAARLERLVSDGCLAVFTQGHGGQDAVPDAPPVARSEEDLRSAGASRLVVTRSARHISAQVVDDTAGRTLASASSMEATLRTASGDKSDKAKQVGGLVAERAKAAGVERVAFDRAGHKYHGRIAALADGAREGGLGF